MSILRRRALIAQEGIPYWYNIDEDWDYIIDQTGKYENPIIVNENNLYADELTSISSVRDMSKLVIGYYDETSAKLIWEPLDNSSKTIVKHTTSSYPINIKVSDYMAEHPTADVFMKLPEFWWRCWNVNNNVDTVAFKFVTEEPSDDNNWFHWNGNTFIGVYKGYIDEVDNIKLLRSISGIDPVGHFDGWENIKLFARNKGTNYSLITYEAHCIMALLGYGFYGTTDVKFDWIDAKDPVLNPNYRKITGIRDGDGMTDTFENNSYVNYWGLEGWFGGQEEYIDNMKTTGYGEVAILDKNSNILRRITHAASPSYYSVSITKMALGYYADLLPTKFQQGSYYGHGHGAEYADYPAQRGSYLSGSSAGWSSVVGSISDIDLIAGNTSGTSRLQYEGNNEQNTASSSTTSVVSSYVLDQTNPNGNPDTAIVFDNDNSVILAIKAASDFYALENKDWGSDTPEFIKMSKTNKLITAEGNTLNPNNYDIFMKLPEFWWKCENVDDNEDKVKFSFTMTNPNDNTWFHWEGDTFIGVYKSYMKNSRYYSRSGVTPTYHTDGIYNTGPTYARNRGDNFTMMTYEIHQIMCILLWGYRGTLDSTKYYQNTHIRYKDGETGITNSNGFDDINSSYLNLWGLEDWFGNGGEVIQNLELYVSAIDGITKGYIRILTTDVNPTRVRSFECYTEYMNNTLYKIGKFIFGSNGDVIPKGNNKGDLYKNEAYNFYKHNLATNTSVECGCVRAPVRSERYGYGYHMSGFASVCDATIELLTFATRLCYKGNYTVASELQI